MMEQTLPLPSTAAARSWATPFRAITLALLRASLRDRRAFAFSMFTPLLMLIIFWLSDPGSLALMAPIALSVTVAFSGVGLAQRLITWREQGIFHRLACTPAPLGLLVLGIAFSQLVVSLLQAALLLGFILLISPVPPTWSALPATLVGLVLCLACFIAYGALLASLIQRLETASTTFMFTFLPAMFLGAGFLNVPPLVEQVAAWLPPALFNRLLLPFFTGEAGDLFLLPVLALLAYTALFSLLTLRFFRWS